MERIEKLKQYLIASPDDAFLRHALALEYIKAGNDAEARSLFEAILAHDRDYTGSYYHLGKLLERQQAFDEAIQVYEKGIEACERTGDKHALSELRMAKEEIEE